ncbi:MAG: hypothetical protein ACQESR_14210 [Planctomycetota bacterium]
MESCPTQAVLPLVGLAAEKFIRDRYSPRASSASTHLAPLFPASRGRPTELVSGEAALATMPYRVTRIASRASGPVKLLKYWQNAW